jgi:hypothetical protein
LFTGCVLRFRWSFSRLLFWLHLLFLLVLFD